ncbi:MAG: ABC transporter permease [Gammaproteobacteria bacterium]|nr:ABC transporter permease [Gammaproteobacteria bacterium]
MTGGPVAHTPHTAPLIELRDITRTFVTEGGVAVQALRGVSLSIGAGEFVSIVGQSGSGKSTLMHLIGCLDLPTGGAYRIGGRDVRSFDPNGLAWLRREVFGFVFQNYNLLPTATAEENVQIPAVYAGVPHGRRRYRALELLRSVGLEDRVDHLPSQLSGGEQQRVSVARSLMNGGCVILADEPTGALDSKSSGELMALLQDLSGQGHTVIVITHDPIVAEHANRRIEMLDGRIVADTGTRGVVGNVQRELPTFDTPDNGARTASSLGDMWAAVRMAMRALRTNALRTFLTLLGIVIGVASVITMLAVGEGARDQLVESIAEAGADRLSVSGWGGRRQVNFTFDDLDAVAAEVPNVRAVLPNLSGIETLRYGNIDREEVSVQGVFFDHPEADNWPVASGTFFSERDDRTLAPVVVLGASVVDALFPDGDPLGKYVLIRNTPLLVIGTMKRRGGGGPRGDLDNVAFIPARTGAIRLMGWKWLGWFQVRVEDPALIDATMNAIRTLLSARHETEGINIFSSVEWQESMSEAVTMATMILAAIGSIALVVGGIGIMNVMLVSVTERTREIGIRLATGARRSDILVQFLVEALVVCAVGGVIGIVMGVAIGSVVKLVFPEIWISFTGMPMVVAFTCAAATGLIFGLAPARNAARMNPVEALAHD